MTTPPTNKMIMTANAPSQYTNDFSSCVFFGPLDLGLAVVGGFKGGDHLNLELHMSPMQQQKRWFPRALASSSGRSSVQASSSRHSLLCWNKLGDKNLKFSFKSFLTHPKASHHLDGQAGLVGMVIVVVHGVVAPDGEAVVEGVGGARDGAVALGGVADALGQTRGIVVLARRGLQGVGGGGDGGRGQGDEQGHVVKGRHGGAGLHLGNENRLFSSKWNFISRR